MLQTIRENTQGWISGVIISLVILSFALWGIHSYIISAGTSTVMAEVNGVDITKEQFTLTYERMRRQAAVQYGKPVSSKEDTNLRSKALQSLVDMQVLKQAALDQGFQVFSKQIDNYLQSMPQFQVDGQFSVTRFQEILSQTLMSISDFLDLIKTTLTVEQPRLGIILTSFALPGEGESTIGLVNQERNVSSLTIPVTHFADLDLAVPPQQIEAYYNEHKNDFMTPEQISVDYIQLSPEVLKAGFNPTDAVLKSFYDENINAYTQPNDKKVPTTQPYDQVKDKVKEAYVRQHAEDKFTEQRDRLADLTYEHPESLDLAAKTLNLPIQTSEVFTKNKAGKDISQYKQVRDTAFGNEVLNLKNNSDVVQLNPETVIVLRIKSHIDSTLLPLQNVSPQIEAKLKAKLAETKSAALADQLLVKLQAGANPATLAQTEQLSWVETGYTGRYSTKVDAAILDTAFRLQPGKNTAVTYAKARIPNGYAVIALKGIKTGAAVDAKDEGVFREQVQNSEGMLEYELYRLSQINQATIKINQ